MDNFDAIMGQVGKEFDNTEAGDFGGDLPDGQYVAMVAKCEANASKASGRLQVSWDIVVVWDPQGSKYKNRHAFFHDGITKVDKTTQKHEFMEIGVSILKKRFKVLGIPNVTKDTMPQACVQAVGRVVAVTLKQKGDFCNVYFDGILSANLSTFSPPANIGELKMRLSAKPAAPQAATLPTQQQQPAAAPAPAPPLQFEE